MISHKKIVVTGGAGFIGSHLVDALAKPEDNNEVIIIDNLSTGKLENIQHHLNNKQQRNVRFIKGSITDLSLLQKTFHDVDYVFHQAAQVSVPKSIEDPVTTNEVNVNGTLNVLLAARDNDVKKVVFASSCAVYGNPKKEDLPLKETAPTQPLSPYALSKLIGEQYCQLFTKLYDLPTVSFRYFNVYGPRQDPNGDYAAVIPKFRNRIKQNKPLIIFGDGKQTRDFVFVDDVASINIVLCQNQEASGIFNVGAGVEITINDLVQTMCSIYRSQEKIINEEKRPGDIQRSFADITKLITHGFKNPIDVQNGLLTFIKKKREEVIT